MPNARWPMSYARSARAPHDDSPQIPKPTRNCRDVNAELREVIAQGAPWARRTEFVPMADGSLRRRIIRHDGTVEKDEVIDAARVPVAAARADTGLSLAEFARLLGVSLRTLQDWESGRRNPSGAAQALLRIAVQHPRIVHEAAA